MNVSDFLSALNGLGIKNIPLIGDFVGDQIDAGIREPQQAALERSLHVLAGRVDAQERLSQFLLDAIGSDEVDSRFNDPLQLLKDAIDRPNDPPPQARAAIERLAARFESADELQAWTAVEFRRLGERVDQMDRRVSRVETIQRATMPRRLDNGMINQLEQLLAPVRNLPVDLVTVLGDAETYALGSEIAEHLRAQGVTVNESQAVFTRPVVGLGAQVKPEGLKLIIGSRPPPAQ
jgi:hypothetical protein